MSNEVKVLIAKSSLDKIEFPSHNLNAECSRLHGQSLMLVHSINGADIDTKFLQLSFNTQDLLGEVY